MTARPAPAPPPYRLDDSEPPPAPEPYRLDDDELPADDRGGRRPKTKSRRRSGDDGDVLAELPDEFAAEVRGELNSRERLLWAGQPLPKLVALRALGASVFGVFFAGFAAVMLVVMAFSGHDLGAFVLIPLVFVAVGGVMVFAPLFAYLRGKRTFYALTSRRALVWQGGYLFGFRSPVEYTLLDISRARRRDAWLVAGAGDLVFREERHVTVTQNYDTRGGYRGSSTSTRIVRYGFLAVGNLDRVDRTLRTLVDQVMDRLNEDD